MSDREKLTELARQFLSLTPDGRQAFMQKLAETGDPDVADWLAIFSQYHRTEK